MVTQRSVPVSLSVSLFTSFSLCLAIWKISSYDVKYKHTLDCYTFLMTWSFILHVICFFIQILCFVLKSFLSDINIFILVFFWYLSYLQGMLIPTFYFQPTYVFICKWAFYRQHIAGYCFLSNLSVYKQHCPLKAKC